eukprot:Skav207490  [mRNA]  locus=scaffold334:64582:72053:+ [translate_table: standard]
MPGVPSPCSKCNNSGAGEGDTWCVGCKALEASQSLLKQRWFSESYRRLGEEVLIQAARQLKAVKHLDSGLQSLSDSWESRIKKASLERASKPASVGKERAAGADTRARSSQAPPRGERDHSKAPRAPSSHSDSAESGEESQEEIIEEPEELQTTAAKSRAKPRSPSRSPRNKEPLERRKRKRGTRPGHRGGARHQKRYRELRDPNFQTHRKFNSADLKLSVRAHPSTHVAPPLQTLVDFEELDTTEDAFRDRLPLPVGAVLTFVMPPVPDEGIPDPATVAVLVTGSKDEDSGTDCTVMFLGADTEPAKAWGSTFFNRKKGTLHLCRTDHALDCSGPERAHHVHLVGFWPAGSFNGGYVSKAKFRELKKFWEELEQKTRRPAQPSPKAQANAPGGGDIQGRLSSLRSRLLQNRPSALAGAGPRVNWASKDHIIPSPGILRNGPSNQIKEEPFLISSGSESEARSQLSKKKKAKSIGAALQQAVALKANAGAGEMGALALSSAEHRNPGGAASSSRGAASKKKKKKRGRSKSSRKRRRSSSGSSSSSGSGSSSSKGLVPPLQKKAHRNPGSVLKLLLDHVRVALSDMSVSDTGDVEAASSVTSNARVQSYFQVLVRPHLHGRVRDEKELFALARAIDILRSGDLERVADHLAARYLAVETAALEGSWDAAKWLEIDRLEDRGAAGPDILLAARKHQRTVEKAAGRNSFPSTYDHGVRAIIPFLEPLETLEEIEFAAEEWVELQWATGSTLGLIGDALCGLQFYWPGIKPVLKPAWRLFKNWRRLEIPMRAPPISAEIVRAFVTYLLDKSEVAGAFLIALGFHTYLRTGELLALQFRDLQVNAVAGVVTIRGGKTGRRLNVREAVAIYDPVGVKGPFVFVSLKKKCRDMPLVTQGTCRDMPLVTKGTAACLLLQKAIGP